jgi:hypothetical protein
MGTDVGQSTDLSDSSVAMAERCSYGLGDAALLRRHEPHVARGVAAWLCRRYIEASLREHAVRLRFSRADSVPNLTRQIETRLKASSELSNDLAAILKRAGLPDAADHQADAKRTKKRYNGVRDKRYNRRAWRSRPFPAVVAGHG